VITDPLGEHEVLRYNPDKATGKWEASELAAGTTFLKPTPLFKKLDDEIVDLERARLGNPG